LLLAVAAAPAAAETQDVEEATSCVVVTLVMLAQGTVSMPDGAISDVQNFKSSMKQVRSCCCLLQSRI
jgi:hypothetical protein